MVRSGLCVLVFHCVQTGIMEVGGSVLCLQVWLIWALSRSLSFFSLHLFFLLSEQRAVYCRLLCSAKFDCCKFAGNLAENVFLSRLLQHQRPLPRISRPAQVSEPMRRRDQSWRQRFSSQQRNVWFDNRWLICIRICWTFSTLSVVTTPLLFAN